MSRWLLIEQLYSSLEDNQREPGSTQGDEKHAFWFWSWCAMPTMAGRWAQVHLLTSIWVQRWQGKGHVLGSHRASQTCTVSPPISLSCSWTTLLCSEIQYNIGYLKSLPSTCWSAFVRCNWGCQECTHCSGSIRSSTTSLIVPHCTLDTGFPWTAQGKHSVPAKGLQSTAQWTWTSCYLTSFWTWEGRTSKDRWVISFHTLLKIKEHLLFQITRLINK